MCPVAWSSGRSLFSILPLYLRRFFSFVFHRTGVPVERVLKNLSSSSVFRFSLSRIFLYVFLSWFGYWWIYLSFGPSNNNISFTVVSRRLVNLFARDQTRCWCNYWSLIDRWSRRNCSGEISDWSIGISLGCSYPPSSKSNSKAHALAPHIPDSVCGVTADLFFIFLFLKSLAFSYSSEALVSIYSC